MRWEDSQDISSLLERMVLNREESKVLLRKTGAHRVVEPMMIMFNVFEIFAQSQLLIVLECLSMAIKVLEPWVVLIKKF